ncbi:DUF4253 domain-containing protein [Actinomycetes bacterium KLBMP 9759]
MPLPAELAPLLPDPSARTLAVALPPGRLVTPDVGLGTGAPAYWLSDGPASAELWAHLRGAHARSGLWPLLLEGMSGEPSRPWVDGEVTPRRVGEIDSHDGASVLAAAWADWAEEDDADDPDEQYDFEDLEPFGLGFDTLYLSVAAPPTTTEHALRVAAEHFAFCPDNIQQGECGAETLTGYAELIRGRNSWSFWWD